MHELLLEVNFVKVVNLVFREENIQEALDLLRVVINISCDGYNDYLLLFWKS